MSLGPVDFLGFTKRAPSELQVNTPSGSLGSAGTRIIRWTVLGSLIGGAIEWVSDAVSGDLFIIKESAFYSISLAIGGNSAADSYGVVRNTELLTTGILSQPSNDILTIQYSATNATANNSSTVVWLDQGTKLRVVCNNSIAPFSSPACSLRITRLPF